MRFARRLLLLPVILGALAHAPAPAMAALTGQHPVVVALCNFSNQTVQPNPPSYYERMFSDAGNGELGALDYWRDISYGNFGVSGTVVKGWYTLGVTRDTWGYTYNRGQKWSSCAEKAKADVNLSNYQDVIVVFPETKTTSAAAITAADTTLTVANAAGFPTPPFKTSIDDGTDTNGDGGSDNAETINVTAVSGNTFTIERAQNGSTAKAHNNGAIVQLPGDLFGFGPTPVTLGGSTFNLGGVVGAHDIGLSVFGHEMGHGFGLEHSRKQSSSTTDYNDCYDLMSAISCIYAFDGSAAGSGSAFGGSSFGGFSKGPGLNAVMLAVNGWLSPSRIGTFTNSTCAQGSYTMAALNHPEVSGNMEMRLPAALTLPTPGNTTTLTDYYSVALRSRSLWDRGIPNDAFVLHLKGRDNYSYWVDAAGTNGGMRVGEEFVDAANNTYVAVNSINSGAFTGQITFGGCKINPVFTYTGDTTGDFSDVVTLAGDLQVSGSLAPIPGKTVTLSLGSQSCTDTSSATGRVSCTVRVNQHPGTYTATGSFSGSNAYNGGADPDTNNFTVTKEGTQVTYDGALTKDYHDAFTASATLVDDDPVPVAGKSVTFTLGSGDSCTDTTDSAGAASCSITPTQPAGTVNMVTSFAGDQDYEASSDTDSFVITLEESTTTYRGPTVVLAGSSGATLSAELLEGGANDVDGGAGPLTPVDPSGQTVTFTLGDQSCSGTTNANGIASCTIQSISSAALGPKTLTTSFAGDAYYLPSSDSDSVVVFAFPSRGAFTLGNQTVSAADSTTRVTWWHDSWWQANSLSGGPAPLAFKGFADQITTLPTKSPANVCGTKFVSSGGNSPPPASGVPSYMGVMVASAVSKKGSNVNGTWGKIVVVRVDPGYSPSPGHPGTGTIVATFCG